MNKMEKINTGAEGRLYELELLMAFLQKAYHLQMDFRLGREVKSAGKFDDLVFRYLENGKYYFRYLQAKHCIHEGEKITSNVLFPSKQDKRAKNNLTDKFHLDKYLISYMDITNRHENVANEELKDLIIFTNVDLDVDELARQQIVTEEVSDPDKFMDFSTPEKKGKRFKLKVDLSENKLCSELKNCSECYRLAEELILQVSNKINPVKSTVPLGVPGSTSQKYAKALFVEVLIQNSENKIVFQEKFLEDDDKIPIKTRDFRKKLLDIAKEKYKFEEEDFKREAKGAVLLVTKTFQEPKEGVTELPTEEISDSYLKNFFNALVFAVNQPNCEELKKLIADRELKGSFGQIDTDFIAESLENKITKWINDTKSKEGWIDYNYGKEFFEKAKKMIVSLNINLSGLSDPFVSSFLRVKNTGSTLAPVKEFIKDEKDNEKCCLLIKSKETFLTCCKLYEMLKNEAMDEQGAVFVNSSVLKEREIRQKVLYGLLLMDSNHMVVECQGELSKELYRAMRSAKKKLILVAPHNWKYFPNYEDSLRVITDAEVRFGDLSRESRIRVLENQFNFQGYPVQLNSVFDVNDADAAAQIINSRIITRLVRDQEIVEMGMPLQKRNEEYYIDRVFSCGRKIGRNEENKSRKRYGCSDRSNRYSPRDVWPKVGNDFRVNGLVESDTEKVPEEKLLLSTERLIIISDPAGMGKSTVLTSLSNRYKEKYPHKWVKRVNLEQHATSLKNAENKNTKVSVRHEAINFFRDVFLKTGQDEDSLLETELYDYYVKKKEHDMAIFLDGLDEICPDYKRIALHLLKVLFEQTKIGKLVVSTRPTMRKDLKQSLGLRAYSMAPFTKEQQVDFLVDFWVKRNKELTKDNRVEKYAECLINALNQSIGDDERELTGIPMQSKMVAEIFEKEQIDTLAKTSNQAWEDSDDSDEDSDSNHSESKEKVGCSLDDYLQAGELEPSVLQKIDLSTLYRKFVKKKYWESEREKWKTDLAIAGASEKFESNKTEFFNDYKLLALSTLLEDILDSSQKKKIDRLLKKISEGSDKNGLVNEIIDGKPQFVHRTFAEYFFVELLTEHLLSLNCGAEGKKSKSLINPDDNEKFEAFIFQEILIKDDYQIIRRFFDKKLEKIIANINRKVKKTLLTKPFRNTKKSAVHVAVADNNFNIIRFLVLCFGDNIKEILERKNGDGKDVIEIAASQGNIKMVEWIIGMGVKLGEKTTLLHAAAGSGSFEVVKYLVDRYLEELDAQKFKLTILNHKNAKGETPLQLASRFGNTRTVELLLEHGAEVHEKDSLGFTALLDAAGAGKSDILDYLRAKEANLEDASNDQRNALHLASSGGHLGTVDYLISKGFNIHQNDRWGFQAIHFASQEGEAEVVQRLLSVGANIHKKDIYGRTPLLIAAESGNVETVDVLLLKGAKTSHKDNLGQTALEKAFRAGNLDIADYLMEKGADHLGASTDRSNSGQYMPFYGFTGAAGWLYEMKLLMFFFLKACHLQMDFRLGRDVKTAGKFDDLVFQYKENGKYYLKLLQAKHCNLEDKKITSKTLFPSKFKMTCSLANKFRLDRYLESYIEIRDQFGKGTNNELKDLIIFTNVDLDRDELNKEHIGTYSVMDNLMDFSTPEKEGKLLKFIIDKDLSSEFKNCSECYKLAEELILQVSNKKKPAQLRTPLGMPGSTSQKYAKALFVQVLAQNSENKIVFQEGFQEGGDKIPIKTQDFRKKLLDIAKEKYKFEEEDFKREAKGAVLMVTKTFHEPKEGVTELPTEELSRQDIEGFFKVLVFAVNQPNSEQFMDLIAKKDLRKIFGDMDTQIIAEALECRMLKWMMATPNESWIDSKDGEKFFKNANKMIASMTVLGLSSPLVSSFLKVENIGSILGPLKKFIKGEDDNDECCLLIRSRETFLTSCKLYGMVKEESVSTTEQSVIFVNSHMLQEREIRQKVLDGLQFTESSFLVIDCRGELSEEIMMELFQTTRRANKKLILVAPHNREYFRHFQHSLHLITDEEVRFSDLSRESRIRVLDNQFNFQGYPVQLNCVFDVNDADAAAQVINSRTITRLVRDQEMVKIGEPLQKGKGFLDNYIKRAFLRRARSEVTDNEETDGSSYCPEKVPHSHGGSCLSQKMENDLSMNGLVEIVNEEKLLLSNERFIIISAPAGMGKSSVLISLSNQYKQTYQHKWVKRVNLSARISNLLEYRRKKIMSRNEAINFFRDVFLQTGQDEDSLLETELYDYYVKKKEQDMAIFLDGLDEICPDYKRIALHLLKVLFEQTKIGKLVVSTRPTLRKDLEQSLGLRAYSMAPFTKEQQVDFLVDFWVKRNKELTKDNRVEKYAECLINALNQSIGDDERELTGIPLLSGMVAETFEREPSNLEAKMVNHEWDDSEDSDEDFDNYQGSGKPEPSVLENIDLFTLYKKFVGKRFWVGQEKQIGVKYRRQMAICGPELPGYRDFFTNNKLLSLSMLLPEEYDDVLDDTQKDRIESLMNALTTGNDRNGLVSKIVDGKPQFVHRSFAEYFFVELLTEHLLSLNCGTEGKKTDSLINPHNNEKFDAFIFQEILIKDDYQLVRKFFDKKLENMIAKIRKNVEKDMLTRPLRNIKNSAVHVAVADNNFNIIRFLDLCFGDGIKEVLDWKNGEGKDVIEIAASKGNMKMVEWIRDLNLWHRPL